MSFRCYFPVFSQMLSAIVKESKFCGDLKTLTPGPRTTYGPVHGLLQGPPLRTSPQNIIKTINKYFSYGLSNRLLVTAKFRTLHCLIGQTWIQAGVQFI